MPSAASWSIRQARLGDLALVLQLEASIWKEMAADESILTCRFRCFPAGFLVAEDDYFMSGFCMALRVSPANLSRDRASMTSLEDPRPQGPVLFLMGLTVDPLFRRKGIGTALVEVEVELAIQIGCESVQLVANAFSQDLFTTLGFQSVRPLSNSPPYQAIQELMPSPTQMIRVLSENPGNGGSR